MLLPVHLLITFRVQILFHSVERDYFLKNLPWLIGSLGTIVEDITVFIQFSAFGERKEDVAISTEPEFPSNRIA